RTREIDRRQGPRLDLAGDGGNGRVLVWQCHSVVSAGLTPVLSASPPAVVPDRQSTPRRARSASRRAVVERARPSSRGLTSGSARRSASSHAALSHASTLVCTPPSITIRS